MLLGEWHGNRTYVIDASSGNLATDSTPQELRQTKIIPEIHTILQWVDKVDPQGPLPTNPARDPQYNNWETAVRAWAERTGSITKETAPLPTELDTIHTEENKPLVHILKPNNNETFTLGSSITITTDISSTYTLEQVDYFLDGSFIGSNKSSFKTFVFTLPYNTTNKALITVKAYDEMKNTGENHVEILISK